MQSDRKKVCFEFVFVYLGSKLFQINCEDKDLRKVFYYCTWLFKASKGNADTNTTFFKHPESQ